MECLVFHGKSFAPLGSPAPDECHGFYERNGDRGVRLYKSDDKASLEAYVVSNAQQGYFIVSASSTPEGPRYMFGSSSLTEKWLGTYEMGMAATQDAIQGIRYVDVQEPDGESVEEYPRARHD